MKDWPLEVFVEFLHNIEDLNTLKNVCKTSSATWQLCRKYRVALCKHFLDRFSVDYNDPTNFIYLANGVRKENYLNESGEPDYCKLFQLYSKFYDKKKIDCGKYKNMTSFPLYPNMEELHLAHNGEMKSLPDGMKKLKNLYCTNNKLESLPKGMIMLQYLDCSNNKLKTLPNDMISVRDIHCIHNEITEIPSGLFSLTELWCGWNSLDSLQAEILRNLTTLSINNNRLRELTTEMPKLDFLACNDNPLEHLPSELPSMKDALYCYNTRLTSLPGGMSKLLDLQCTNCQLTSLPEGMIKLKSLFCSNNRLTSLPSDMKKLVELDCRQNPFNNEFAQICNSENSASQYKQYISKKH